MPWHLARSQNLDYLNERHISKVDLNFSDYPSERNTSKLDSNLPNYPSKRLASKLDSNLSNYLSKRHASKLHSNFLNYPKKQYIFKLGLKLFKCSSDTVQPPRVGFEKNHYRVLVNITVVSNSKLVEFCTYKSTICQGRDSRLLLSIRQVLGTSRNFYKKYTSLLRSTINLHTEEVARGTASWTQQAWPLRYSFGFNLIYPPLGSGGNQEKFLGLRCLELGFK